MPASGRLDELDGIVTAGDLTVLIATGAQPNGWA